jgi:hypothetical protein
MLQVALTTYTPRRFLAALEQLDTEGGAHKFVQAIIKGGQKKAEAMKDQAIANPLAPSKTPAVGEHNKTNNVIQIAAMEVAPAMNQPRPHRRVSNESIVAVVSTMGSYVF